jgi:hypothetical protein
MCFRKKLTAADARILTFGKNKYGGQDLNGCVNDSNNLIKKTSELWKGIDYKLFTDYQVTASSYLKNGEDAIATLSPGAVVCVVSDSCFSESVTRFAMLGYNKHPIIDRCYNPGYYPRSSKRSAELGKKDINWIHISACLEHETAADCWEGQYVGALSWFLFMKSLRVGMTYGDLYESCRKHLPSNKYGQTPTIEGPDSLLGKVIMKDQTLWIHNSSHGSYQYDTNGDEKDGQDEGLFFDRLLVDDEIREMLLKIPKY